MIDQLPTYNHQLRKWMLVFVFTPSFIFPLATLFIAARNKSIFQGRLSFSTPTLTIVLWMLIIIAAALFFLKRQKLFQENLQGLILLLLFIVGYYLLARIFNRFDINTNNVYFEADNWSWLRRMALEDGRDLGIRAVHPFSYILFRPLVATMSLFTSGNPYEANISVLSLAGGGCVFLMWKIVKQISSDEVNAILFASLLGLSSSHLIFAGVIETYIFSALCLLFSVWLLINNKSIYLLAAADITTFGITISNIVQQGITTLLVLGNLKRTTILFAFVISISIGLNILSKSIYPSNEYVFIPGNLSGEREFQKEVTLKRAVLMAENLFVYNITAPEPYTSIRNEMPRFNFLNGTINQYAWFGWPSLIFWLGTLILAFFYFLKDIRLNTSNAHLAAAMFVCLLFNYVLHIGYGVEPFLYSPDWTYALVLFVAITLGGTAKQNWFKIPLFLLVLSIFVNNMWILYLIAGKVSKYLG
ncbi:MAG: hypothetical protein JNM55_06725 [Anaerolineales bacterium]|nr:hypothetical protein [Anaerolineales bacterium]